MAVPAGPAAVLEAWVNQHPIYAYTTRALERTASGEVSTTLHVSYVASEQLEIVDVVSGSGAGTEMRWSGGDTVAVRPPGLFHIVRLRLGVRDPRVLSPRKNDIRTGVFERVVECYAAQPDRLRVEAVAPHELRITLRDDLGVRCGPEYGDDGVTVDRITIDAEDGHPLERERLAGSTLVEQWSIGDLQAPPP
jgi:hypothetical protein